MLISKHFGNKSGKSNDMDTVCQQRHALRSEQVFVFFSRGARAPSGLRPTHNQGFRITLRHTKLGSTPLDERSARRRGLNLTTHNNYDRHPVSSVGFKTTIPASGRPQTLTLDRATTGIGVLSQLHCCTAQCLMFDDSVRWVGPMTLGRRSRYVHSKRRKPHTQRLSVICQKTEITPLLQSQNLACRTFALGLHATFSWKLAVYFDIHLAAAMRCFCPLGYKF